MTVTVDIVLATIATLIGVPAGIALLIDVLKWAGAIKPENAGKVSAALNMLTLIAVAAVLQFYPRIDIGSLDARLLELVKFAALIFQYLIQITATKIAHKLFERAAHALILPKAG